MADEISISMTGTELFHRQLRSIARRSLDFSPVLRGIGHKWIDWIEEQFGTEGVRFNGVRWQGLAVATIKSRDGAAHPILFDEGDLFDEMTSHSNLRVSDHELSLKLSGKEQKIADHHQYGTRHMPRRKILDFTPEDRREIVDDLGDFLFERGRGRRI
jgi:phage gpG-like protein